MCKVIAICNQKGGVSKTTTTVNLGVGLVREGKKVLVIDADPQGNLSQSLGIENPDELEIALPSIMEQIIMDKDVDVTKGIIHHEEGVDLMPCNIDLSGVDVSLVNAMSREFVLKTYVESMRDFYDYILIDAPPTLGGWVMNILCASDYVLVPVEASPWGMFGLANMFDFLNEVREIAPDLKVLGIVVTKADARKNYFKQTMETLKEMEGIYLFESFIRVDSSIEWSQDSSEPVVEFKKSSRSAKEYIALAEEVMNRVSR